MHSVVMGSISDVSEIYAVFDFRIRMNKVVNVEAYINFKIIDPR
jgi:hypothetical protein